MGKALDSDWAWTICCVVQATNVATIYLPEAVGCESTISMSPDILRNTLNWRDAPLKTTDRSSCSFDPDKFIGSVLRLHRATICSLSHCEPCINRVRKMKEATSFGLLHSDSVLPRSWQSMLDAGANWALIHSDSSSIDTEIPRDLSTQQSRISNRIRLTTVASSSTHASLVALHDWICRGTSSRTYDRYSAYSIDIGKEGVQV